LLAIGALALIASCGSDDAATSASESSTQIGTTVGVSSTTTSTTGTEPATATVAPTDGSAVLFAEDFDDDTNGWGVVDGEYGTWTYDNGDYVWDFTGRIGHLIPETLGRLYDAGELAARDVEVRASLTIEDGGGVAGVFCREVPDTDAEYEWYEFVVRDGYGAIRRADLEGNLEVLAETTTPSIEFGRPFELTARCIDTAGGEAMLSLDLDDQRILDATDSDPIGNGVPGIEAWTYPPHDPMGLRWHQLTISTITS
jgi:hypothetical protein